MKIRLFLCCLLSLAPVVSAEEETMWDDIRKAQEGLIDAQKAYHRNLAQAFTRATHIEVFLLEEPRVQVPAAVAGETDEFWKTHMDIGDGQAVKILQSRKLTADEIKLLMPAFQDAMDPKRERKMVMCFSPIHGIRIFDGKDIVFQGAFCYSCELFSCIYPLKDYGGGALVSPFFEETMTRLMPIPEKVK